MKRVLLLSPLQTLVWGCLLALPMLVACTEEDDDQVAMQGLVLLALQQAQSSTGSAVSCATTGPCKIFVTISNATLNGGISGLDNQCASDANKPADTSTYKAMVADGTNRIACTTANCGGGTSEHTDWVLQASKEYRRKDGTTVVGTTTASGVFSFPLSAAVETTTTGTNTTATGLNTNWTSSANDCSNWGNAASNATTGLHDQTSSALLSIGTSGCGNSMKVLCVEQ